MCFRCEGLVLLETYSALDDQELLDRLPKFLDIEAEVTGNAAYSMFNLSLVEDWDKSKHFCHYLKGKWLAKEIYWLLCAKLFNYCYFILMLCLSAWSYFLVIHYEDIDVEIVYTFFRARWRSER